MPVKGLKPRGQRAATFLGTGVLVALFGLVLQMAGVKSGAVVGTVIGLGGLIIVGAGVYWALAMATHRDGV